MSTLKFEVGKFYADRKGRKWECVCNDLPTPSGVKSVLVCRSGEIIGHIGICGGHDRGLDTDIISEWSDPIKLREVLDEG